MASERTEIQRFKLDHSSSNVSLISSANGSFVAWYDHECIVSELKSEIERLRSSLLLTTNNLAAELETQISLRAERDQLRLRVEELEKERIEDDGEAKEIVAQWKTRAERAERELAGRQWQKITPENLPPMDSEVLRHLNEMGWQVEYVGEDFKNWNYDDYHMEYWLYFRLANPPGVPNDSE